MHISSRKLEIQYGMLIIIHYHYGLTHWYDENTKYTLINQTHFSLIIFLTSLVDEGYFAILRFSRGSIMESMVGWLITD